MLRNRTARLILVAVVVLLAFCVPAPVLAQEPAPCTDKFEQNFPAGIACKDFELQVSGCFDGKSIYREFFDKNGNPVRTIAAGTGNSMTFKNPDTGKTLSTRSNGSVWHTTINPDGTKTVSSIGHNVIIMFPTDVPAGPSTTLYVGKVVYTDDNGTYTILRTSGNKTDICAALK